MFTPVLAKHTKSFNLIDTLSVGVDRIQRNFEPLQRQVELWRKTQITDDTAKLIFYSAFIDGQLEAPRSLLSEVHRLYFEPQSRLGRCGACQTPSPAPSRSSIQRRSSRQRRSWRLSRAIAGLRGGGDHGFFLPRPLAITAQTFRISQSER